MKMKMKIVSDFFTSLAAVMVGMLFFIAYRYFEVFTLFERVLPKDMGESYIFIASNLISVVFIFSMLIMSVNINKIFEGFDWIMGIVTLIINLYFWQVWEGEILDVTFKVFISVVTAILDFVFAHLFISKRKDYENGIETKYQELSNQVKEWDEYVKDITTTHCIHCTKKFETQTQRDRHQKRCKYNDQVIIQEIPMQEMA